MSRDGAAAMANLLKESFDAGSVPDEHIEVVEEIVEDYDGGLVPRQEVVNTLQEQGYSDTEAPFLVINAVSSGCVERKEILFEDNEDGVEPGIYLMAQ